MTEFLKDWCHYMRKDELDEYELELVKSVEDTISQVNNYKTRYEKLRVENAKLRWALESAKDIIHSEFCSSMHHPFYIAASKAVHTGAEEKL